jgi:hypothetical protein
MKKLSYFSNLTVHAGFDKESRYHTASRASSDHEPLSTTILQFFQLLDANVSAFDALLHQFRKVSIFFGSQVNGNGNNSSEKPYSTREQERLQQPTLSWEMLFLDESPAIQYTLEGTKVARSDNT